MRRHTDHPDYPLYKDKIEALLKEGFPLKQKVDPNHYTTQPPILQPHQFSPVERLNKGVIGSKKGFLTVIGFKSEGVISLKQNLLVCKCSCGAYCLVKYKTFDNSAALLACSECCKTYNGFSNQFAYLHGVNLDNKAICSIFGCDNVDVDILIRSKADLHNSIPKPFEKYSLDELKALTSQYNAFSIEIFKLAEDKNHLISPKSKGESSKFIQNCYVQRPELLDIEEVPDEMHNRNISQFIGARINRFQVVGVVKTENGYEDYTQQKAKLALRCDCGMYSTYYFHTVHRDNQKIICCPRCNYIAQEVMRREFTNTGKHITVLDAWKILGFTPPKPNKQFTPLNTDLRNSYFFERRRFDKEEVWERDSRHFGERYGFVVITDKARRRDETKGCHYVVANCDCGQECVFPYEDLMNTMNRKILACSKCAYEINQTLHKGNNIMSIGNPTSIFMKRWRTYLNYFNYPNNIEFTPIWKAYLLLKQKNPNLPPFKNVANKLIDAAINHRKQAKLKMMEMEQQKSA